MAKAPRSSTKKTTKPKALTEAAKDAVEDAVVVEEIPPEPEAPTPEPDPEPPAEEPLAEPEPRESEAKPEPVPAPPARPRSGFGSILGLVTGGILAAVIGFGAARYVVPDGWPFPGVPPKEDPVAAAVETQGATLDALGATVAGNTDAIAGLKASDAVNVLRGEVQGQVGAVQAQIEALDTRLDDLEARLTSVEKLAPGGSSQAAQAAAQAYERELAEMRAMLDTELARISQVEADAQTLESNASEAAKAAAGRAALSRVVAALDTGRPFDEPLFDLTASTGIEAPAALAGLAADGVPTLAGLQEAFPPAARAALEASVRAAVDDGSMSGFTAFLRTQLGTRSLEPKAGDDPDAVLSRAEDALRRGEIAAALTELEAMPEAATPALADWKSIAETRAGALAAGAALSQELNAK